MKLVRLRIRRLPGIEQPYGLEDLDPGLNFVGGPNGSGKSSIARAVRAVLWPQFRESEASEVTAWFGKGGEVWRATLVGRECTWTKNDRPHPGPLVPPAEHARCFTIGAEDLRDFAGDDGELASLILRQLSGGYDIEALRSAPPLDLGARHGQHERRLLHRALKELEQTKNQHRSLEARERNLVELRRHLSVAREARQERIFLEKSRQLQETRESGQRLEEELASLPHDLDRLAGDELERLDATDRALDEVRTRSAQLDANRARYTVRRDSTALGESGLPESRIRAWRARVETLRELDRSVTEAEREARRAAARSDFSTGCTPDANPHDDDEAADFAVLTPELLRDAEELARDGDELAQHRAAILAELDLIPDCSELFEVEVSDSAIRLLRTWLRAPDRTRTARTVVTAMVIAFAAVLLTLAVRAEWAWVAPLFFAPLLPSMLEWWRERRVPGRDRIVGEFKKLECAEPRTWTSVDVLHRLEALELEAIGAGQREHRQRLEAKLRNLEGAESDLEERRRRIHEALGVDPLGSDLGSWVIGRELVAQCEAREQLHVLSVEFRDRQARRDRFAEELATEIVALTTVVPTADGEQWSHAIEDLADRAAVHAECRRELDGIAEKSARATLERRRLEAERERLFSEAEVEGDDRRELSRRLEALPRFRALTLERKKLEWRAEELGRELRGRADLKGSELLDAIARCEELARRHEELVAAVNEIEREVSSARSGHTLEDALAEVDAARQRLEQQRERALLSRSGNFLIRDVLEEHRERSRPRLLERAIELFGAFTRDRFRLTVGAESEANDDRATFHAIDVSTHDVLAPSALSSGTRTQLLLSVRLAFALESERGTALPFFLDEVLSHSDPERSRAVAQSLRHLVENESRQVFYLSCQPEEEALFREAFDASSALTVFDLGRLRGLADRDPEPRVPEAFRRDLPDPSLDPEAYGRAISVPRFDLSRGLEAQHVFHVLAPNNSLVHRLLELGIETVGQLATFLQSARSQIFLEESELQAANAACLIAREFTDAWAIGRGRPIDRRVLVDAGVRGRFLSSLSEVAEESAGDATAFMKRLDARVDDRTKGFRQQRELTEFLEENGYLDRRPVRASGEVHVETLSRLAPLVESGRMDSEELSRRIRHLIALSGERPRKKNKRRSSSTRSDRRSG